MTKHFRPDNTEGYNTVELAELNALYECMLAYHSPEDRKDKSVQDAISEHVLFWLEHRYDR